MNNTYKLFLVFFVLSSQFIRIKFQKNYKKTHVAKTEVIKPVREQLLYFYVLFSFLIPDLLWIFDVLNFAQINLPHLVRWLGIALGFLSGWLFYATHKQLGDNWSGTLELRENHKLITTGVYRLVRHPMYLVFWLNVLSATLITANWIVCLVASLSVFILCIVRIPDEEQMMLNAFGDEYREYMKRTKRLIPYLI